MLNIFTKTKPWMVASLFAATSVFAQDNGQAPAKCRPQKSYEQGHEMAQSQMMAGYNATARVDVRGAWDFYLTGSFIYWQPIQENMELGISTESTASLLGTTTANPGNVINFGFEYKPGFKVGLGMNFDYDNWDAYSEYTWFHGSQTTSSNGPISIGGTIFPFVGTPGYGATHQAFRSASETWTLKMDFADLNLGRSYYVGTKLSFRPFVGARGAWIRQKANYTYANTTTAIDTIGAVETFYSNNSSVSWGVGPSAGLESDWMLGYGIRVYGKGSADLLYTRYNTYVSEQTLQSNAITTQFSVTQKHIDYLRPHMDLELGLGWGSYFDNNNWHIDLSASYGFQAFWDQNMFRHFTDSVRLANSNVPNGNLYVQGLTTTVRLDF